MSPEVLSNPGPFLHLPPGHAEVAMQRSCVGTMLPRQSGTHHAGLPADPCALHHQKSGCAHWPIGSLDTVRQVASLAYAVGLRPVQKAQQAG